MCPGSVARVHEDLGRLLDHDADRCKANGRVQIALDGLSCADATAGHRQRHSPVDTHNVCSSLGHEPEQLAGADAEMDPGHAKVGHALEDLARGGENEARVVRGGEHSDPAVEELDRRGAGLDLGLQCRQCDVGKTIDESDATARDRRA